MKAVIVATFFILSSILGSGQDAEPHSGSKSILDPKIDLADKLPEDFDWPAYFARSDQSTGGRAMAAVSAHFVLRERIDQICSAQRKILSEKKNQKAMGRERDFGFTSALILAAHECNLCIRCLLPEFLHLVV